MKVSDNLDFCQRKNLLITDFCQRKIQKTCFFPENDVFYMMWDENARFIHSNHKKTSFFCAM